MTTDNALAKLFMVVPGASYDVVHFPTVSTTIRISQTDFVKDVKSLLNAPSETGEELKLVVELCQVVSVIVEFKLQALALASLPPKEDIGGLMEFVVLLLFSLRNALLSERPEVGDTALLPLFLHESHLPADRTDRAKILLFVWQDFTDGILHNVSPRGETYRICTDLEDVVRKRILEGFLDICWRLQPYMKEKVKDSGIIICTCLYGPWCRKRFTVKRNGGNNSCSGKMSNYCTCVLFFRALVLLQRKIYLLVMLFNYGLWLYCLTRL